VIERRVGPRYKLTFPVDIHSSDSSRSGSQNGYTQDISGRGVYLRVDEDLAVGATINFIVTLSAEVVHDAKVLVRARGRVVRIDKLRNDDHKSPGVAVVIESYNIFRSEPAPI
jgi:PilZ domain